MDLKNFKASNVELQTLAQKLDALFRKSGISVAAAARALQIPVLTIRRLLSGKVTDPKISTLKLLATYFEVPVDYLIDENETVSIPLASIGQSKPQFIPILDWETAGQIESIQDINLGSWKNWQSCSLRGDDLISNSAFALESRPSMYPRFPQGTIFIIDPEVDPTDGDTVLVKIRENNELTLRELVIDPPIWSLNSVISSAGTLHYTKENHKIVGVIVLTMLYNKKIIG